MTPLLEEKYSGERERERWIYIYMRTYIERVQDR